MLRFGIAESRNDRVWRFAFDFFGLLRLFQILAMTGRFAIRLAMTGEFAIRIVMTKWAIYFCKIFANLAQKECAHIKDIQKHFAQVNQSSNSLARIELATIIAASIGVFATMSED